ncbi:DUF4381 domain-containing protein [Sulfitobacter sp. JL08]|uniref:DUF4381 domain-containing protein n=1 Tax=Sulfitobacter sp. JL08 TaxID=2070369 RepID=UPI000E0AB38F|nr:DUF4381 domain-containing protein [Sulfitobacter sp. JL08]AXI56285.1 DUF4381 domain-containing protein [Sulfitobacter sp. JL08]
MSEDLSKLGLTELYDQLIPITTPPQVPLTPQTAGWLILAAVITAAGIVAIALWRRRYRANAYRRAALAALQDAGDNPAMIAHILRRTAIAAYPRDRVAGLIGDDWLGFLDATCPDIKLSRTDAGQTLLNAPYTATAPDTDLAASARRWIKSHTTKGTVP